tara:strand:- start:5504 stop:5911 length:408 start_codon:yes stop_codon:yes gene_type:complete
MSLTGKTGKYQNEIKDLKKLDLSRYERIFKVFTEAKDGKEFYFYNLLNKIEFPENIDSSLLDTYIVKSREPLTAISYNLYGDIESWWMIYLLNKDLIGKKFFVEGGIQLSYIIPSKRGLIFGQITKTTVYNNKHF